MSFSFVTINWIAKRWPKVDTKYYKLPVIVSIYLLVLIPLKLNHSIGIARNTLWRVDKILLGTFVGSIVFLLGIWADKKVRKVKGRQLFKFQRVVFPVLALIIASAVFYLITK